MINHARTLLMNVSGASNQRQNTGEEYIPAGYLPVALPSYLLAARRLLLGSSPDRYFLNYRVHELMAYLHQTELAEYVYALDPRVTYWPENDAPFFDSPWRVTIEQTQGPSTTKLSVNGRPIIDNATGRCLNTFTLAVVNSGDNLALAGASNDLVPLIVSGGLSNAVALEKSGLSVLVNQPIAGSRWSVTTFAKPAPVIASALPALEIIGEPTLLELFGVLTTEEPYATFKNLWIDHPNPVYRLGGFVLAMIYRTEEIRKT